MKITTLINKQIFADGVWYAIDKSKNLIYTNTPHPSMKTTYVIQDDHGDLSFGYKVIIKDAEMSICDITDTTPLYLYSNVANATFRTDISKLKNSIHIKVENINQLYELFYRQLKSDNKTKYHYQWSEVSEYYQQNIDENKIMRLNYYEFLLKKNFNIIPLSAKIQTYEKHDWGYQFLGSGLRYIERGE